MGLGRKGPINQSHMNPKIRKWGKERELIKSGGTPRDKKIVLDMDVVNVMKKMDPQVVLDILLNSKVYCRNAPYV